MKFLRKHIVFLVGVTVGMLLLLASVVVLFRYRAHYTRAHGELNSRMRRLEALNARDPFPSERNVAVLERNLKDMESLFEETIASLRAGQVSEETVEASEFPPIVVRTVRDLQAKARQADVVLPTDFAFTFDRYLAGESPESRDVPLLTVQLREIQRLSELLFSAKISSLTALTRQTFETDADATRRTRDDMLAEDDFLMEEGVRRRRRTPAARTEEVTPDRRGPEKDPDGLFTRQRYSFSFKGSERSVWEVLKKLANAPSFIVVRDVRLSNVRAEEEPRRTTPRRMADDGAMPRDRRDDRSARELARPLTHQERIVAGREEVSATIEFDVYRFKAEAEKETAL